MGRSDPLSLRLSIDYDEAQMAPWSIRVDAAADATRKVSACELVIEQLQEAIELLELAKGKP